MTSHRKVALFCSIVLASGAAFCATPSKCSAQGLTVQLPTVRFFSVDTTVMVPDGGTAFLGGVSRHAEGSVTRGVPGLSNIPGAGRLFKNRAIGSDTSRSGASVSTRILIMSELEAEVMAEARRREAARQAVDVINGSQAIQKQADAITRGIGRKR